jgi:DNA-binding transcriptional regulator YdaS (Cro superfamily)
MNGLKTAIQHFGSRKALAEAMGLTVMAIHQWETRQVPAERAVQIEQITGGKVKRQELRPDLYM